MSATDLVAAVRGAAVALGLPGRAGTAADLAAALGVAPAYLAWVLDLLVAEGDVTREGDRYRASAGSGGTDGPALPPPAAALVAKVVRRGAPLGFSEVAGNIDAARLVCSEGVTRVPPALVARLSVLVGASTLLDLGCGDGAIAAAVLAAAPAARARLVDRDLRHAMRLRGPRVELVGGEVATVPLAPARVVLLSHVLHGGDAAAAAALVRRAAALVEPGGTLVIREVALDTDRRGPRFGLAFATSLLLYGAGELPTEGQLRDWVSAAGCAAITTRVAESILVEATPGS